MGELVRGLFGLFNQQRRLGLAPTPRADRARDASRSLSRLARTAAGAALPADPTGVIVGRIVFRAREETMAELAGKRFESPDEVREFTDGKGRVDVVDLNGHAIGRGTFEPGWRWSENVKPIAGTDSCQVEHIGYVMQGRMALMMDDGTEREFGPGDIFHMPPGHDAWIVGEEACVILDFGGLKGYAQAS